MKKIDIAKLLKSIKKTFGHIDSVLFIIAVSIGLIVAIVTLNNIVIQSYDNTPSTSQSSTSTSIPSLPGIADYQSSSTNTTNKTITSDRLTPFGE